MHTGAAARMTASPLASDIAAGAETFGNPLRTPSATSVSNADASTAQQAASDGTLDRAAGASPGRGTPQPGPGQHSLGMPSPAASQSSVTNAPSSAAEGSGTRAASAQHAALRDGHMLSMSMSAAKRLSWIHAGGTTVSEMHVEPIRTGILQCMTGLAPTTPCQ